MYSGSIIKDLFLFKKQEAFSMLQKYKSNNYIWENGIPQNFVATRTVAEYF